MQNKPNLLDTQMNVTIVLTKDYENVRLCKSGKKQTQSNPIYSELVEPTCSELACTEQGRSVEPIANQPPQFQNFRQKTPNFQFFLSFYYPF
jgi:hypothetical protein